MNMLKRQFFKNHLHVHSKVINKTAKKSRYPIAMNLSKVGSYPAFTNSGAGYFYDDVLEYRVWVHPEMGGKNLHQGDDYCIAFSHYEDALKFSKKTKGAEKPQVLVLQKEWIDEPRPKKFIHKKTKRITEWQPQWLKGDKRTPGSIKNFLKKPRKMKLAE